VLECFQGIHGAGLLSFPPHYVSSADKTLSAGVTAKLRFRQKDKKMNNNSKAAALLARIKLQQEEVGALTVLWGETFPQFNAPDTRQFKVWLNIYDFDTVVLGIDKTLNWYNKVVQAEATAAVGDETVAAKAKLANIDTTQIVRYASGCMKMRKAEQSCKIA
jgi:hypothetical protein